jgi:1,4-dihydroxy-2-naphthoyl-CoA hydrolase
MTNDSGAPLDSGIEPQNQQMLTRIQAADTGGLGQRMGIDWLEVGPERTVARMPVAGNTQPFGLLHGGASAVLAESVGSVASNLHAGPGRFAVGIELSCTHHRGARDGFVTAVATPLSRGRTLATYHIEISDDAGHRICTARLTCLLRDEANATGS